MRESHFLIILRRTLLINSPSFFFGRGARSATAVREMGDKESMAVVDPEDVVDFLSARVGRKTRK